MTGRSQVGIFLPYLKQDYPGIVVDAWESGNSIAFWDPEDRMWAQLVPLLHQRLRALVYSKANPIARAWPRQYPTTHRGLRI